MLNEVLRDGLAINYHINTKRINKLGIYDMFPQYKLYPVTKAIKIEDVPLDEDNEFIKVLFNRQSQRKFCQQGVTLKQLGRLLSLSFGFNHRIENGIRLRTYASAGARYPIEVYPIIIRSVDMEPGIYHYNVIDNSLELIRSGQYEMELSSFYMNQTNLSNVPCYLMLSMVFERTMEKYGDRGYRFIYLDAGHMSQNLYLVAEFLGLGVVAISGGNKSDTVIDSLLRINCCEESFFYGFAVGIPEKGDSHN